MPHSQAALIHPKACHSVVSTAAPHCSYSHAREPQPSSQLLLQQDPVGLLGGEPEGVPRGAGPDAGGVPSGAPPSAGPDTSHDLLMPLQLQFKQSAAQTQAALLEANKPSSRNGNTPLKACADCTGQVSCTPAPVKFPSPLASTVKQLPAEPHGKEAMQEAPSVTQQLLEKQALPEHQQKQSAAECRDKLAMQKASLVSLQLPDKLLLPPWQVADWAQLPVQLLLFVIQ